MVIWEQLGLDINGVIPSEKSGYSVSISSDGTIVAIGAPTFASEGTVRVYQFVSNAWTQLGADITGLPIDVSGFSISLSSNGFIVAIGAIFGDGINGTNTGIVRVFEYLLGNWVPYGGEIDGPVNGDNFAFSVSISADGNTLIVGNRYDIDTRVYNYVAGTWSQQGSTISTGVGFNETSEVEISKDATTIAIASFKTGSPNTIVKAYKYNGVNWIQHGLDFIFDSFEILQNGISLSLSEDGSILAIGYYDNITFQQKVEIYKYTTGWTQQGADIGGSAVGFQKGKYVSLSGLGNIVSVGNANSGRAYVYYFNGTNWILSAPYIENIGSQFGHSVSLSYDGTIMIVGDPVGTGVSRVYGLVPDYVISGTGLPGPGDGVDGQVYLDENTNLLYGPKTAGVWNTVSPLNPDGATGAVGDPGPAGIAGTPGATGAAGPAGPAGPPGATGAVGTAGPAGAPGVTGVTGPAGPNGPNGIGGATGATGFTGPPGPNGINGINGTNGTNGSLGPPGSAGPNGSVGVMGIIGDNFLTGTVNPTTQGKNGDYYINTVTGELFGPKNGNPWPVTPINIGNSNSFLSGSVNPPNTLGLDGDVYLNTSSGEFFGPKGALAPGVWPPISIPVGNNAFLTGPNDPTSGVGTDRDIYLNTTTGELFGPKGDSPGGPGIWQGSLKLHEVNNIVYGNGPPTNSNGVTGNLYIDTATLKVYGPKNSVNPFWSSNSNPTFNNGKILVGPGAPLNSLGQDGNLYLNTTSLVLFGPKGALAPGGPSVWPTTGVPLSGSTIIKGTTDPSNAVGNPGDLYLNTTTNTLFGPKGISPGPVVWPTSGTSFVGQRGPKGIQVGTNLSAGNGAPLSTTGNDGDFYIDLATGTFYGPKGRITPGVWNTTSLTDSGLTTDSSSFVNSVSNFISRYCVEIFVIILIAFLIFLLLN